MPSQARPSGAYLEYTDHEDIFVPHRYPEHLVDLGEIRMNYAVAGSAENPAILLIPAQTHSWWSYEKVMELLAESYQVYAVDLRGQGRSTWTPGRYTFDIFGNDLVRFIDRVIGRPVIACGLSSGGVLAAWLSAFAAPGQIVAAVYEDPPLFTCEISPAFGHSVRQGMANPLFQLWGKWLGPQWSVGDVEGMTKAMMHEMPDWIPVAMARAQEAGTMPAGIAAPSREYDPEWAIAFSTGRVTQGCDHEAMLKHVKVPVLFTHHFRQVDPLSGNLVGAISDLQAAQVKRLVEGTGNSFKYLSFPNSPHPMHEIDPGLYARTVTEWLAGLGLGAVVNTSNSSE